MLGAGLLALVVSLSLVFLPALWGEWDGNKYFVASGLIGTCLGLSLLVHGAWDWVCERLRRR